jgi:hypothetical protein
MAAQTVLEELTGDELTTEHVQHRVKDWVTRIDTLYTKIKEWLPADWTATQGNSVTMSEELMATMDIPPQQLPTLELMHDGVIQVTLRPYGLWIIGTNGRVDLIKGRERYLLLDHADTFETAQWHVALATSRRDSELFDGKWLQALLAA